MTEEILALCKAMGAADSDQTLLLPLIEAAAVGLEGRLKPGYSVQDCGSVFPLAAAMLAMDGLEHAGGGAKVTSFTAGDVSIRTGNGGAGASLADRAEVLMSPWLKETGFAFQGVPG